MYRLSSNLIESVSRLGIMTNELTYAECIHLRLFIWLSADRSGDNNAGADFTCLRCGCKRFSRLRSLFNRIFSFLCLLRIFLTLKTRY